jgi:hypothetical protein
MTMELPVSCRKDRHAERLHHVGHLVVGCCMFFVGQPLVRWEEASDVDFCRPVGVRGAAAVGILSIIAALAWRRGA